MTVTRVRSSPVVRTTSSARTEARQPVREVGHSSRSSFSRGQDAATDRAALAGFRGRGRALTSHQARATPGSTTGTLRRGMRNQSVRSLQEKLNASGFDVGRADGRFGARTERALRDFQRSHGLRADGVAGRRTFTALHNEGNRPTGTRTNGTTPTTPRSNGAADGVARMDRVLPGKGLATGSVTVNGHTYQFNSGSSRLFSTPTGTYRVTAHRNSRSDRGYVRDGVGFSFLMEDPRRPGSDRFYDPRAGRDRVNLRIHPDGGARGTAGCLGILGDAATLRQFRDDMNAELRRNGGSFTLRVE
ncbi:MAG: peptidoglycan-binding domain-containing protein [Myxococcaceae bacterium]